MFERFLEYRSTVRTGRRYEARPYAESDAPKINLSGLFLVFAISCPITIVIANA